MVSAGNKARRLSSINHTIKTIQFIIHTCYWSMLDTYIVVCSVPNLSFEELNHNLGIANNSNHFTEKLVCNSDSCILLLFKTENCKQGHLNHLGSL